MNKASNSLNLSFLTCIFKGNFLSRKTVIKIQLINDRKVFCPINTSHYKTVFPSAHELHSTVVITT